MELLNPTMNFLLNKFKLDIEYIRAEGLKLYDRQDNVYLDFIAQYGAVPFGYNNPEINEAARNFLDSGLPTMIQPSVPVKAVELAESLTKLAPGNMTHAVFCQSGTEAVEASIKLARSTTGKFKIVSAQNSFHGKTMGALSATGRPMYQEPFFVPVPGFETIPYDDLNALETKLKAENDQIAGFIIEPIQGEGGIIIPSAGYLKNAELLCRKYNVLFIVDEIQTGLGRTGSLFACDLEQVNPDILLLSKALGGGLVPIGVCLSSEEVWNDDFGRFHSSTFANNNFTCSIALAVIDMVSRNNMALVKNASSAGTYLVEGLKNIDRQFPGVIKEVRGRGLMTCLEFNGFDGSESFSLRGLAQHGGFSALLAGYLLHNHGLRLAPFLNNSMTLRLQPSLTVTKEDVDTALKSIGKMIRTLYLQDYAELYRYLLGKKKTGAVKDFREHQKPVRGSVLAPGEKPTEKFAFLIHYPAAEDVVKNNPSFGKFSPQEIDKLLDWEASINISPGVIVHLPAIRSKSGKIAEGWLIAVPYSGKHLIQMSRQETTAVLTEAVNVAKNLGAKIVGLGAYTSVVSRGGSDLQNQGVAITSGNSFTVATAFDALIEGSNMMGIDRGQAIGCVIGATGAIGRVCSILLADEVQQLYLVGNPEKEKTSLRRLEKLADEIYEIAFRKVLRGENYSTIGICQWIDNFINSLAKANPAIKDQINIELEKDVTFGFSEFIQNHLAANGKAGSAPIKTTVNIRQALMISDLVVSASNAISSLIWPEHLKSGCVVCDVARPADVSQTVLDKRQDVLVIEGGLVRYPDKISFGQNLGFDPGMNLACLSETMLLSLEGDYRDFSIGLKLPLEDIYYLKSLAKKHGFELAVPQNGQGKITPEIAEAARRAAEFAGMQLKIESRT